MIKCIVSKENKGNTCILMIDNIDITWWRKQTPLYNDQYFFSLLKDKLICTSRYKIKM